MKAIVITAILAGAGGYVGAVYSWDWLHTQIIGAKAKAEQLRIQARNLEAKLKAVF